MWGAPMTHHCLSLLSYTPQSLCALFLTQNRAGHRILTSLPFHSFLVINMSHWSIWLVASILISSSTQVEKFLQRVYCIGWVKSANTPGGFCDLMVKKHDTKKFLRGKSTSWLVCVIKKFLICFKNRFFTKMDMCYINRDWYVPVCILYDICRYTYR